MKIAILSRSDQLYSTGRLLQTGLERNHEVQVIDHTKCNIIIENSTPKIIFEGNYLTNFDAIIPRIGASVTRKGIILIKQFENSDTYSIVTSNALSVARDKLISLQMLSKTGIKIPRTFFVNDIYDIDMLFGAVGGFPLIIKLLESTHGSGVILVRNKKTAISIIEAFSRNNQSVIVQEFIKEAKGSDIRSIVIGGKIVATMKRQARQGEFRSNIHRGASATPVKLSEKEKEIVIKAAGAMNLDFAGVDFLLSKKGPLVMEVNASPGLEGIETVTKIDVAGKVFDWLEGK